VKVVFVSNYFNHHQKPFCEEMYHRLGSDFAFVSTGTMRAERIKLGYTQNEVPPYVCLAYADDQKRNTALKMIHGADVVIAGDAPEEFLRERLRSGKLVLRYSERPFKKEPSVLRRLYHGMRFRQRDRGSRKVYMLCASAYTAVDFASVGMYKNRMYKWGYFPAVREYDPDALFAEKKQNTILWCGRFIDWKHPDDAVKAAQKLKENGCDFRLNMIGTGDMEEELKRMARECGVADVVRFLGSMPPERVRAYMEEAGIYLFTSDRQEGWGAVLNEAMASGCAVVASDAAGATPFLVQNEKNGLIYGAGDLDMLVHEIKTLLDSPGRQSELGESACRTMTENWNARTAADRILEMARRILAGEKTPVFCQDGPCSPL
jgi:glycosyltransferase involved in cell wall biosynthesis